MRPVVFIGPSLPQGSWPDVELRPPAVRGDLERAVADGFTVIGLVDGRLYEVPTVPPSEVVAVAVHARLWGAASLGALRAVECPAHMVGVGRVYSAYLRGDLRGDDEVVGTWEAERARHVAPPLVVVRGWLAELVDRAVISVADASSILRRLRRLPFDERRVGLTRAWLERCAVGAGGAFAALVADPADDLKQRDARALLDAFQAAAGRGDPWPQRPTADPRPIPGVDRWGPEG